MKRVGGYLRQRERVYVEFLLELIRVFLRGSEWPALIRLAGWGGDAVLVALPEGW